MGTTKSWRCRTQDHKTMMFTIASIFFGYYPLHFLHNALPCFHHTASTSGQCNAFKTTSSCFLVLISLEWDEEINVHMDDKKLFFCSQHSGVVAPQIFQLSLYQHTFSLFSSSSPAGQLFQPVQMWAGGTHGHSSSRALPCSLPSMVSAVCRGACRERLFL